MKRLDAFSINHGILDTHAISVPRETLSQDFPGSTINRVYRLIQMCRYNVVFT